LSVAVETLAPPVKGLAASVLFTLLNRSTISYKRSRARPT
jgi:hypothetical protein